MESQVHIQDDVRLMRWRSDETPNPASECALEVGPEYNRTNVATAAQKWTGNPQSDIA